MPNIWKYIRKDNLYEFKKFLEKGTDINIKGFDGMTPLHHAALKESTEILNFLISEKAEIDPKSTYYQETPLQLAVQEGYIDVVKLLLDAGADPNSQNVEGENALFVAIRFAQNDLIQLLIDKGADINSLNIAGEPPLALALLMHNFFAINLLVELGAKQDIPTIDSEKLKNILANKDELMANEPKFVPFAPLQTPDVLTPRENKSLLFSYRSGPVEITSLYDILLYGTENEVEYRIANLDVPIDSTIFDNETPLLTVSESGRAFVVKILLENGANPNAQTLHFRETPLHRAAEIGNEEIVKLLLEHSADPNILNIEGESPLFTAIRFGHSELIPILLQYKASPNIVNLGGQTAIQVATLLHDPESVFKLKNNGADVTLGQDNSLQVAMDANEIEVAVALRKEAPELAEQREQLPEVQSPRIHVKKASKVEKINLFELITSENIDGLKKAIAGRIELNYNDEENGVPLVKAIEINSLPVVQVLIGGGANPDYIPDKSSIPPLHKSIMLKHDDITNFLLSAGASVKIRNNEGENVMYLAIRQNNIDLVKKLISYKIPLNIVNHNNMSPLYMAIGLRELAISKVLLDSHADPNSSGLSCLKLAQDMKDPKLINLLMTAGAKSQIKRSPHKSPQQQSLKNRTQPLKMTIAQPQEGECMICKTHQNLVRLIPCSHVICCKKCVSVFAQKYHSCPICTRGFYATALVH